MNGYVAVLDSIPEQSIAVAVYLLGSLIAMGGFLWIVAFAILLTPTVSEGANASIAPAIFGLLFGVLTKEQSLVWINASLILFVIGIGSVIGYCWSTYVSNKSNIRVHEKSSPL